MPVKNILFLGDICSEIGRQAVMNNLARIQQEQDIFFTVVQAENAANGYGITPKLVNELLAAGIDCITLGDHFLDRKEIVTTLVSNGQILRPANFHIDVPGRGYAVYTKDDIKIGVGCLLGRVYLKSIDCPFQTATKAIALIKEQTPNILFDFHAEATAEKRALGWFLDGKVTAVIGTHTHVVTADEQILSNSTAYITDIGMCGAMNSVLGMRIDLSVKKIMYNIPLRLEAARHNIHINGVIIAIDTDTGKAIAIRRFDQQIDESNL